MEMNGLSLLVFLLFNVIVGGADIYIATGANYTFRSHITTPIQSIQWTLKNNLVVECDPPGCNPHWYRFKNQADLNQDTGDLTVKAVKIEDSGVFKGQFQVNGVLQYAEYSVTVVDPVSKPIVTCKEDNETHSTLTCKVEPPVQDSFEWRGPDGTHNGPSVQITTAGQGLVYYCTAANKVSKEATEFSPDSKCFKDPENHDPPINVGAVVGGIFGGIFGVIFVAGVIGWLKKDYIRDFISKRQDAANKNVQNGQASNNPNADESMRLQAQNNDAE